MGDTRGRLYSWSMTDGTGEGTYFPRILKMYCPKLKGLNIKQNHQIHLASFLFLPYLASILSLDGWSIFG